MITRKVLTSNNLNLSLQIGKLLILLKTKLLFHNERKKNFTKEISQQTPSPIDKNHNFILRTQQRCDKMKKVQ